MTFFGLKLIIVSQKMLNNALNYCYSVKNLKVSAHIDKTYNYLACANPLDLRSSFV